MGIVLDSLRGVIKNTHELAHIHTGGAGFGEGRKPPPASFFSLDFSRTLYARFTNI